MHYIRTSVVEEVILTVIRRVAGYVLRNESEFIDKVRAASNIQQEVEVKERKKRLGKANRRHGELDTLVKKLYETYALGKLPENHYDRMLAEYDAEQKALRQEISDLQEQIDGYVADSVKADKFIDIVHRYTEIEELTVPILNSFVEKVIIHEGDKSSGKRVQKVDVYLNFIGKFDVDPPEKSADEIEAERVVDEKRRKNSERQREYRKRKKQKEPAA